MTIDRPTASVSFVVDESSTAIALGSGDVPVLGTPKVVALCEEAAVAVTVATLGPGETSVGTAISVEHTAPSGVGALVTATATLIAVDGRAREYTIVVTQEGRTVATGSHHRVVVDRSLFVDRIDRQ